MNFECPLWLQQLVGISSGAGNESVLARLELLRPLGSTFTLLIAAGAAAVVFYCYFQAKEASRPYRILLAALRLSIVAILIAMIGELSITLKRAGLPSVVVLVDDSESMNIVDRYADEAFAKKLAGRIARYRESRPSSPSAASAGAALGGSSRLDAVRALLLENEASFLQRLADRNYHLRVFAVSDAAHQLPLDAGALRKALEEMQAGGKTTRLGDGLRTALEELRGQPIAAVVLFSDGVNTAGADLAETAATAAERNVALLTVGLGETKKSVDVELADLKTREYVMVNDLVSFDFTLTGRGSSGKSVDVTLREAGDPTTLTTKTVRLGEDDVGQAVRLTHRPTKTGTFRFIVEAKPLEGEASADDNRLEATIEVRTDKVEVLLVQSYPNFEYRYLKHMLGRDETVHLTSVLQEADQDYPRIDANVTTIFPVTLDELLKYDVVVFGDVDPEFLGASALAHLRDFVLEKGRGVIFAAGPRYMPMSYRGTVLADLLPIDWNKTSLPTPESLSKKGTLARLTPEAYEEPIFQLDDTSERSKSVWTTLAPIYWMLETEKRKSAQTMLEATEGKSRDGNPLPLVLFQRAGRGMVLFHTTDETWRWRWRVGDLYFARYWVQALRQLALAKGSGRLATLRVGKDEYEVGKPVALEIRFQDERLVPSDGNVNVVIESEGRPDQTVKLTQRRNLRNLFEASVTGMAEGKYRARFSGALNTAAGLDARSTSPPVPTDDFTVASLRAETMPIEADHAYLIAGAAAGKGAFFRYDDADRLFDRLPRGRLLPTEPLPPVALWNKWFALLLFVALAVGEWLLRKRQGMI
ncbi:MAG: VWA domain-containing protein [Planctomycetia bacterium]|nr:VWA domain-containing protein [Planctomycetia bacterium]